MPLGGVNGYVGVHGKQGRKKDKYQGVTPRKQHRTGPYETPKEAAVALAHLRHDLELGLVEQRSRKKSQPPAGTAAPRKLEVGTYLGLLLGRPQATTCESVAESAARAEKRGPWVDGCDADGGAAANHKCLRTQREGVHKGPGGWAPTLVSH